MQSHYIDTTAALTQACAQIGGAKHIGIDTEFVRENTYYPIPCLVQISCGDEAFIVDVIAIEDFTSLFDVLCNRDIEKILHSGRQDLELFFNMCGKVPGPVFDTQIAATLLGQGDQIGYAAIVELLCGEKLDKAHTRTDWRRRPLGHSKLEYAVDDVRFLIEIRDKLAAELVRMHRQVWLAEECARLTDVQTYQIDKAELWKRVKDYRTLSGVRLVVLQALASWREEQAIAENKPRKWIVADETLIALADRMPESSAELTGLANRVVSQIDGYGQSIIDIIVTIKNDPGDAYPALDEKSKGPLSSEHRKLVEEIAKFVKAKAVEYGIDSTTIVARKELKDVAMGARDGRLFKGWRHEVVGGLIQARFPI